jgi:hypothetical protein
MHQARCKRAYRDDLVTDRTAATVQRDHHEALLVGIAGIPQDRPEERHDIFGAFDRSEIESRFMDDLKGSEPLCRQRHKRSYADRLIMPRPNEARAAEACRLRLDGILSGIIRGAKARQISKSAPRREVRGNARRRCKASVEGSGAGGFESCLPARAQMY